MNRRHFVEVLGAGLVGGLGGLPRSLPQPAHDQFVERWSWAMGQPVHVMVVAASEAIGLAACAAALAELRRVETKLSRFDDASDLSELNRHAGGRAQPVDEDLRAVVKLAQGFREATHGAFDIAVEPLMRAWGFHRPRRTEPSAAEIAEAREAVATAVIRLEGERAHLPNAHTQLDLGGIGVGYGIDRAMAVLRSHGVRSAFLDVSGDCAAIGAPPGESGWLVEIADPHRPGRVLAATRLRDAALATSANTHSGHVMNPASGWPADALRQTTVVASSCATADALSTAMLVSGRRPPHVREVYPVGA
ncbi:MAG: FAD:protein FMN transferase [Gemmatimonadales bacterium]